MRTGRLATGGATLAFEERGRGAPVVLISGLGYCRWYWHRVVPLLEGTFRVLTFDNRGVGQSDQPPGPYTTRSMAEDVAGLLRALAIERCHLVGHSLGGFIAQELALAYPALVDHLVLISTSPGGPGAVPVTPEALRVMTTTEGDPRELFAARVKVAMATGFPLRCPEVVEAVFRYRQENVVPPEPYRAQLLAGAGHDAHARLSALRAPTLVVTGDQDRVVPPENAALLQRAIAGAQVRTIVDAGHMLPLERPSDLAQALLGFLPVALGAPP